MRCLGILSMLKHFILRSVALPGKLMMACPKATGLSLCVSLSLFVLTGSIMLGVWFFLILQACMIVMTDRDPYFMNAILVSFRCKKTHNFQKVYGNCYDA